MKACPYCKGSGEAPRFRLPDNYMTMHAVAARTGRCWKTVYKHMLQGLIHFEVGERDTIYKRGNHHVRAVHVVYMIRREQAEQYIAYIEDRGNRRPQKRSDRILAAIEAGASIEAIAQQYGIQRQSVLAMIRRREAPPRVRAQEASAVA